MLLWEEQRDGCLPGLPVDSLTVGSDTHNGLPRAKSISPVFESRIQHIPVNEKYIMSASQYRAKERE